MSSGRGIFARLDELGRIRQDFRRAAGDRRRAGIPEDAAFKRGAQRNWDERQKEVIRLKNEGVPLAEIEEHLNKTDPDRSWPV
jgi:hypothetical protein